MWINFVEKCRIGAQGRGKFGRQISTCFDGSWHFRLCESRYNSKHMRGRPMSVYIEYVFLENFLLDGLLLYLALKCARGQIKIWRIILSAAVGGGEALLFPILKVPKWVAYLIKILGGILLSSIVVHKGSGKVYLVVTVSFFAMTFLLGGLLTAIYSFFEIPYLEGEGFYVENAPVALILAVSGCFAVVVARAAKAFYSYGRLKRNIYACCLTVNGKTVRWHGFADSGNCLSFRGEPVSVVSAIGALALFSKETPVGRIHLGTVNGSRDAPVFYCQQVRVETGPLRSGYFTVGEFSSRDYQIILHTALVEGAHEGTHRIKSMAEKVRGK